MLASYDINIHKNNENIGSQLGHTKNIFLRQKTNIPEPSRFFLFETYATWQQQQGKYPLSSRPLQTSTDELKKELQVTD